MRGFDDLGRFERMESFHAARRTREYKVLRRVVPNLGEIEREWDRWGHFAATVPPASVREAESEYAALHKRLDRIEPALGSGPTAHWRRWLDYAFAALLERYVADRPGAPDVEQALARLMTLYSHGERLAWRVLPREDSARLEKVSTLVLARLPDSELRADALLAMAVVRYSKAQAYGRKARLDAGVAAESRIYLEELLAKYPASRQSPDAILGLIRLSAAGGRWEEAAFLHRQYREAYGGDRRLLDRSDESLGHLAIRLGGLPNFQAETLGGEKILPGNLGGRVILLDFWATWCRPCVEELGELREINGRQASDRFRIIGVSLDDESDLPVGALRDWLDRKGITWSQIYDGKGWESDLVRAFRVKEIPFNVLVGLDGSVLGTDLHGEALAKAVEIAVGSRPRGQ